MSSGSGLSDLISVQLSEEKTDNKVLIATYSAACLRKVRFGAKNGNWISLLVERIESVVLWRRLSGIGSVIQRNIVGV